MLLLMLYMHTVYCLNAAPVNGFKAVVAGMLGGVLVSITSWESEMLRMKLAVLPLSLRIGSTLALAVSLHSGIAVAVESKAENAEFDVEVYSQQGAVIGCGLSFVTAWVNREQQVFAAAGALTFFAKDPSSTGSMVKVRATLNNQSRDLSFAWVSVQDGNSTKAFSPLTATQTGPSFSFFGKPDQQGLVRLGAAARGGFTLGISIAGLLLDETVQVPATPSKVYSKLQQCMSSVSARIRSRQGR